MGTWYREQRVVVRKSLSLNLKEMEVGLLTIQEGRLLVRMT